MEEGLAGVKPDLNPQGRELDVLKPRWLWGCWTLWQMEVGWLVQSTEGRGLAGPPPRRKGLEEPSGRRN